MKKSQQKYISFAILFSIISLMSGFCYNSASASTYAPMNHESYLAMDGPNCDGQSSVEKNNVPVGNNLMPCCVDSHDNVPTTVPATLQDKIKFSDVSVIQADAPVILNAIQKTYVSSPSPPPEPDILYSVVKIE